MKLKVFGGLIFLGVAGQVRCVMATTSRKKVALATGINESYIRDYWALTGNAEELRVAHEHPGEPMVCVFGSFMPLGLARTKL